MPNTLEENVNRVKAAKTAIGNAITAKGGTVGANDGLEDFASDIATIPSGGGGGSQPRKDVNFYDYDGTIVNSYTAAEFANLSAMPDNPSHEGLTAQGWNWSLNDAKSYVASYGKLEIGQMYITSDDKTRIYIKLTDEKKSPTLQLYLNINSEVDIDWGDGSTHSTFTSSSQDYKRERHEYSASGDYVIVITPITGSFLLKSGSSNCGTILYDSQSGYATNTQYLYNIEKIELGSSIGKIEASDFYYCTNLKSITIPNSVTSIGDYAFARCLYLKSITVPNSVISIGDYAFGQNKIVSLSLPNSVTSMGSCLYSSDLLEVVTIPNSINLIPASTFGYNTRLKDLVIPNTITQIKASAFGNCYSLVKINIPSSVTSMSTAFSNCYSLRTITINKSSGSITGSPWGAPDASIIWTG